MILLYPNLSVEVNGYWVAGCIVILGGVVCYSLGGVYSKQVSKRYAEISPIALNAAQMIHGGALLLILSMFTEQVTWEIVGKGSSIGSLFYLTVVGSMMGHSLFYWLVAKTTPMFPATWLYISPLIALGLGVLWYEESVSWLGWLGSVMIIGGTLLVNLDTLKEWIGNRRVGAKRVEIQDVS